MLKINVDGLTSSNALNKHCIHVHSLTVHDPVLFLQKMVLHIYCQSEAPIGRISGLTEQPKSARRGVN